MSSSTVSSSRRTTPFLCNIYGYNRAGDSRKNISKAADLGDLQYLTGANAAVSKNNYAVRMLFPHYAELTEAYFSMHIEPPSGDSWSLRLAVAEFQQSGGQSTRHPIETGYSESYVDEWHHRLTNRDDPYQADGSTPLDINDINIAGALKQLAANQKYQEAFCLLLVFNTAPDVSNWSFTGFRVVASGEVD